MATPENSAKTAKRGRPFKPGQSGNPGGRPKTAAFNRQIRDFLNEPSSKRDKTKLRLLIERLYRNDPRTLLAYAYGKPVPTQQPNETNGEPCEPMIVEVVVAPERAEAARELVASGQPAS